jgi:hypothetical protein
MLMTVGDSFLSFYVLCVKGVDVTLCELKPSLQLCFLMFRRLTVPPSSETDKHDDGRTILIAPRKLQRRKRIKLKSLQ